MGGKVESMYKQNNKLREERKNKINNDFTGNGREKKRESLKKNQKGTINNFTLL